MAETPERLAGKLASEGQKTIEFFRALSLSQWDCTVYSAGPVWTVRHLLAHFVSAERALKRLIEDIAAGGPGAVENYDVDAFNAAEVPGLVGLPVEELLQEFQAGRDVSISMVKQLQQSDLANRGRHPVLGMVDLEDIIKLLYRHNQIHLRDLRRLLEQETGNGVG